MGPTVTGQDHLPQQYSRDPYRDPEPATHDPYYLGKPPVAGHFRDRSVEVPDDASGLAPSMQHQNSRTNLQQSSEGYYNAYPDQPRTPSGGASRVHYPPQVAAQPLPYTSVPLRDRTDSDGMQNVSANTSGRTTPTGYGSASSKKKHWFSTNSSHASLEAGQMGEKQSQPKRPKRGRNGSWDLLGNNAEWEGYNPANAKNENLRFAEGDVGTNKASRLYYWLLNRSIIIRWAMYIIPVLGLLWIPGILGFTAFPDARVWGVKLVWWSIWLSVVWGGFWAATAVFLMVPAVWRNVVGTIIPSAKQYTDVIRALGRYAKLVAWAVAIWVSFTPLVINHYEGDQSARSRSNLSTVANLLFALLLSTMILSGEKLVVQLIAFQFHQDSYEDRLQEQKFNIKCLATLYIHSHDIPGRTDTLKDNESAKSKAKQMPKKAIRAALKGLREAAQTTTTALGNVASEMAGQSVLQTNSPSNKVTAALSSANKSKALARRLFYSFRKGNLDHLTLGDIARFFPDLETAETAFAMFDKDGNGDATRDEIESAVLTIHRERLSLEASMRDLDGAIRRLDDIFMVIVFLVVILILAAAITTKITALVTSAGTFVLGLSWLIGSTMQEILLACIFLFVKHPYDVGDRIALTGDENTYTVAKMALLSTNFKRGDGKFVWMGHNVLATKTIENIRRSGAISETFTFEVMFETSFDNLRLLREKMIAFCKENSRDFLPIFDVTVDDIPAQGKMVLKADIRYKSNWQQVALKVMRRNKWICALKLALADLKIYGPAGAGDPAPPPPDPTKYTLVPWQEVQAAAAAAPAAGHESPPPAFETATATATNLTDRREIINDSSQDIWDETNDTSTSGYNTRPGTPGADGMLRSAPPTPGIPVGQLRNRVPHGMPGEEFEMISGPVARR